MNHAERVIPLLTLLGTVGAIAACAPPAPTPEEVAAERVRRGEYLVTYGGCDDCHTPKNYTAEGPVPDMTRRLSGHPANEPVAAIPRNALSDAWVAMTNPHFTVWAGAWGVSFAVNLTPHETGMRSWTDSLFIASMRTGKHMGSGRPILPPMPYFNVAALTDEDLRAVFAFLRSLPPIDNAVPAPLPPPEPSR